MRIILILLIFIILIIVFKNNFKIDYFNTVKLRGTSNIDGTISDNTVLKNLNDPFISKTINPYDLSSEDQTRLNNIKALEYHKTDNQEKYLDNAVQAYNQVLIAESGDVTYYYNSLYNNNDITEDAYNVENSIDAIDYSKIKESGREKCRKHCKGTCLDGGFTGVSSCIPITGTNYGSLYKNPEFTYGLEAPYYNVNNKEF